MLQLRTVKQRKWYSGRLTSAGDARSMAAVHAVKASRSCGNAFIDGKRGVEGDVGGHCRQIQHPLNTHPPG